MQQIVNMDAREEGLCVSVLVLAHMEHEVVSLYVFQHHLYTVHCIYHI